MTKLRRVSLISGAGICAIALSAFMVRTALTQGQANASLASDKANYATGEIATLTGAGFQPSEPIGLSLSIDQPVTGLHIGDSQWPSFNADANGGFVAEYPVPSEAGGMMMRATAVGGYSRSAATTMLNNPAWVSTDREDYPPLSLVYITGKGFLAGEIVSNEVVQVAGPAPGAVYDAWGVEADTNGHFDTTWYVFSDELFGTTLELTAIGQTSGLEAQSTFTDGGFKADLQGLSTNSTVWISGDLLGWEELQLIPMRVILSGGTAVGSPGTELEFAL